MPTGNEFTDVRFDNADPVDAGNYPNAKGYGYDPDNSQFSSKMSGDPISLLESTRQSVEAHADLNASYGLLQPVATLGSHPFLRDGLTTPDELAPGNAEPQPGLKIPGILARGRSY